MTNNEDAKVTGSVTVTGYAHIRDNVRKLKLTYRVVSYDTPFGRRYYAEAWDYAYNVRICTQENHDSYIEARLVLQDSVFDKGHTLTYFDGEYRWSPEKGLEPLT